MYIFKTSENIIPSPWISCKPTIIHRWIYSITYTSVPLSCCAEKIVCCEPSYQVSGLLLVRYKNSNPSSTASITARLEIMSSEVQGWFWSKSNSMDPQCRKAFTKCVHTMSTLLVWQRLTFFHVYYTTSFKAAQPRIPSPRLHPVASSVEVATRRWP